MGNKCCQIEEVASILNIIKALVENVSTSISTQTAITTIQQYINHFNGNLISGFRLEPDGRTITIELANGNTFPLVLDRVLDVRLNQAGTEIIVTHSNPLLSNTIPLPIFNGLTIVNISNPSNVNLYGEGTVLNPLEAEAIIEHSDTPNTTVTGNGTATNPLQVDITVSHQDSATISIAGDGTQASPLIAEYIGPSQGSSIVLNVENATVSTFLKNGVSHLDYIPVSLYSVQGKWIFNMSWSDIVHYPALDNKVQLNVFKDTINRIIEIHGRMNLPYGDDTNFGVREGAMWLINTDSSSIIEQPIHGSYGGLSGIMNSLPSESDYSDFDFSLIENASYRGDVLSGFSQIKPFGTQILICVYKSMNNPTTDMFGNGFVTFSLKYKY